MDDSILFDFVELFTADRAAGRSRSLSWYLTRFRGSEEAIAREYLSLLGDGREAPRRLDETTRRLGKYEIERELGRGGQGTVYLARDPELDRPVAIKVLEGAFGAISIERKNRLRREAVAVSKLDHPGVCVVYEADLEATYPYIAMRYVEGRTLASLIADGAHPSRPTDRAALHAALHVFERAARALHAAHEAGVIHRDIKPGNLMLDERGHPVVLDFGLALDDEVEPGLTRATALMGTPSFLSPEQLDDARTVTYASDVFSLGVTLFELLTGQRPFEGKTLDRLCDSIRNDPAPNLLALNPYLPEELRVVVETALAKRPAERYPSALEFAEDLRRLREYEPIVARPASLALRTRRWWQRNPVLGTASLAVFVSLVIALLVSVSSLREVNAARDRAYAGFLRDQATAALAGRPKRALLLAMEAARAEPSFDSNRVLLSALDQYYLRSLPNCAHKRLFRVDVSPDGRWVLCIDRDTGAHLWDPLTGETLESSVNGLQGVSASSPAPHGSAVALGSLDGSVYVCSIEGDELRELGAHRDRVNMVCFAADGRTLATASSDGTGRIWDAATGRVLLEVEHGTRARAVYLTHDGTTLVTASGELPPIEDDGRLNVWDVESGELRHTLLHPSPVRGTACDPRGQRVAAISRDGIVSVWSLVDGSEAWSLDLGPEGYTVTFSPDGREVGVGHGLGAEVRDAATGERLHSLAGHEDRPVSSVAFSTDGTSIATGSFDQSVRIWERDTGQLVRTMWTESAYVYWTRWGPGDEWLVGGQKNGSCFVWYARRPFLPTLFGHEGAVNTVRFDPDGVRVLTASADGTARVWDTEGRELLRLEGHAGGVSTAVFDDSGERVLTASSDGTARLWNANDGRVTRHLTGHSGPLVRAEFGRGDELVLTASEDGTARVHDASSGAPVALLAGHTGPLLDATFSPDGALVATCAADRSAFLFDAASGEELWALPDFELTRGDQDSVFDVEFSRDGRWLAVAAEDGATRFVDLSVSAFPVISAHSSVPGFVAFHADADQVLTAAKWTSTIWARTLPDLEPVWNAVGHRNRLTSLALSRSARFLVTGSLDRSAILWDATDGTRLVAYPHGDSVLDVSFSPDEALVATACKDGTARLWPVDLLQMAERYHRGDLAQFGGLPNPGDGR